MFHFRYAIYVLRSVVCVTACLANAACGLGQEPGLLNVNDISFLWPVPKTSADAAQLIAADEKLSQEAEIWTESVFKKVLAAAVGPETAVVSSAGTPMAIRLHDPAFQKLTTWKVAGIRIDPSAPGCDGKLVAILGSTPQIRFVMQPVTVVDGKAVVHDFTAHVVFDFVKRRGMRTPSGEIIPAIPDKDTFAAIVQDLIDLKKRLEEKEIRTDGKLGVHPGFSSPNFDLPAALRTILRKYLSPQRLNHVAFMGIRRPEPWIFYLTQKNAEGEFAVQGSAHMLFLLDTQKVLPEPKNGNLGSGGVSTAPLLRLNDSALLESDASIASLQPAPKLKDIPDIIANPRLSHALNTDCVSCHTESSIRTERTLPPASAPFLFTRPKGFDGVKDDVRSEDLWNVRNFGWGIPLGGNAQSTASTRTANEAADAADFINRNFIAPPTRTGSVSNALTLVMKAKNAESARKLKQLVTAMQSLPPEQNPIFQALERLGNVHNARFVFLDENTLAVITTFDDDFDTYIDLFIDEIGDVFNQLLQHVDGAPAKRVQEDREAFRKFVREHDIQATGTPYSAYPLLRVQDIKALERKNMTPSP